MQAQASKAASPAATPRHEPPVNPFFVGASQAQAGVTGAISNAASTAARALNIPAMTRTKSAAGPAARGIPSEMSLPSSPIGGDSTVTSPRQGAPRPSIDTSAASKHANPIVDRAAGHGMGAGGRHPLNMSSAPQESADEAGSGSAPGTPRRFSQTSPVTPSSPSFAPNAANSGSLGRSASRSSSRRRSTSQQSFSQSQRDSLRNLQSFHLANNPQGNIGLQNALNAIEEETKGMVWIGALGDKTDSFDDSLKAEVDDRLWKGVGPAQPDGVERRAKAVWIEDKVFEGSCESFAIPT